MTFVWPSFSSFDDEERKEGDKEMGGTKDEPN
jgi:hypothetical protein